MYRRDPPAHILLQGLDPPLLLLAGGQRFLSYPPRPFLCAVLGFDIGSSAGSETRFFVSGWSTCCLFGWLKSMFAGHIRSPVRGPGGGFAGDGWLDGGLAVGLLFHGNAAIHTVIHPVPIHPIPLYYALRHLGCTARLCS